MKVKTNNRSKNTNDQKIQHLPNIARSQEAQMGTNNYTALLPFQLPSLLFSGYSPHYRSTMT